jgi:lactate dehydrogenase-like 2-hydroxyacid dehydrogenase
MPTRELVGSEYDSERLARMYSRYSSPLPYPSYSSWWIEAVTNPQLGLIGLGNIGLQIANLAQALGFKKIIYHTRTPNLSCPEYTHVPLEDLYAESDAIVITCPLNNSTRGMINDKAFEGMKEDMILVNVARGPIVDDEALVRALDSGKGMSSPFHMRGADNSSPSGS